MLIPRELVLDAGPLIAPVKISQAATAISGASVT